VNEKAGLLLIVFVLNAQSEVNDFRNRLKETYSALSECWLNSVNEYA